MGPRLVPPCSRGGGGGNECCGQGLVSVPGTEHVGTPSVARAPEPRPGAPHSTIPDPTRSRGAATVPADALPAAALPLRAQRRAMAAFVCALRGLCPSPSPRDSARCARSPSRRPLGSTAHTTPWGGLRAGGSAAPQRSTKGSGNAGLASAGERVKAGGQGEGWPGREEGSRGGEERGASCPQGRQGPLPRGARGSPGPGPWGWALLCAGGTVPAAAPSAAESRGGPLSGHLLPYPQPRTSDPGHARARGGGEPGPRSRSLGASTAWGDGAAAEGSADRRGATAQCWKDGLGVLLAARGAGSPVSRASGSCDAPRRPRYVFPRRYVPGAGEERGSARPFRCRSARSCRRRPGDGARGPPCPHNPAALRPEAARGVRVCAVCAVRGERVSMQGGLACSNGVSTPGCGRDTASVHACASTGECKRWAFCTA